MLIDLRRASQRLLPTVGALVLIEGAWAHFWLGVSPIEILWAAALSTPILILYALAILHARALATRVVLILTLLVMNYSQYAFASFYARFVAPSELQLLAENSPHELRESILLYSSSTALLAALTTLIAYAYILKKNALFTPRRWLTPSALIAAVFWSYLIGGALPTAPAGSPEVAFLSTYTHALQSRLQHRSLIHSRRLNAPSPTQPAADFDIIYLVGESLRADRFPPGNYSRNVTPFLHALTLPHVAFNNVTSDGDCTGRSMPYLMVAPARPLHLDLYRRPTLFDYAKKAGFRTAFVYANENDWTEFVDGNIDLLRRNGQLGLASNEWTYNNDEKMIDSISNIANSSGPQFLVVETYTSHWPYGDRYQSCSRCRIYRPDNIGRPVPFSTRYRTQIVNSYDNAMLYFDQFVAHLMASLKKPTLVIFTSDHAESLGEHGRWGHCSAAPEQFFVPLMFIATDAMVAQAAGFSQLARRADTAATQANVFPSILGYFGYSASALSVSYAINLFDLSGDGEMDRSVLISEIGTGAEPVQFAHINKQRMMTSVESAMPGN
jgi:glucan phosphoethanolaminetransferase (alkaline phosphatase superfamily)